MCGCVCMCLQRDGNRVLQVSDNLGRGNPAHRAPEVLKAWDAFPSKLELVTVDYNGQAVYEVGVLLCSGGWQWGFTLWRATQATLHTQPRLCV